MPKFENFLQAVEYSPVVEKLKEYNTTISPSPFIFTSKNIQFNTHLVTFEERTKAIELITHKWRKDNVFPALKGWRDELYPVYGPQGKPIFVIERAAAVLFGISTFGVHVNAFVRNQDIIKMWVAKRSSTKQTWPGVLDNCVAGGMPYNYSTKETVVKECDEEASIPESLASNARSVSIISYYTKSKDGLQPETEYIYDLELPVDYTPIPKDGEVECFYLWTLDEVKQSILNGDWKPNCSLVALEFMMRHSYITADNEPNYLDISYRLHRRLDFPGPKKANELKQ
ncbi:unnamed protein product [Cunninghamella echinulata]